MNPFRTAVPFWGQSTQSSSSLSPKRGWGSKWVERQIGKNITTCTRASRGGRRLLAGAVRRTWYVRRVYFWVSIWVCMRNKRSYSPPHVQYIQYNSSTVVSVLRRTTGVGGSSVTQPDALLAVLFVTISHNSLQYSLYYLLVLLLYLVYFLSSGGLIKI